MPFYGTRVLKRVMSSILPLAGSTSKNLYNPKRRTSDVERINNKKFIDTIPMLICTVSETTLLTVMCLNIVILYLYFFFFSFNFSTKKYTYLAV